MGSYSVFTHPTEPTRAVRQGWSLPAMLLSFIWAFANRLWMPGAAVLVGLMVLGGVMAAYRVGAGDEQLRDIVLYIAAITIGVIFGMKGNGWIERNLVSRGYRQVDTVNASSPGGAITSYVQTGTTEH